VQQLSGKFLEKSTWSDEMMQCQSFDLSFKMFTNSYQDEEPKRKGMCLCEIEPCLAPGNIDS